MFEQERMIGRIQRRVLAEPAIKVSFLCGSYGRRTEDAYSDIDVALVYADEMARDAAWRNRETFAKDVMPYVPLKSFDGDHVRPFLFVTLFSNGSKVDFRYETLDTLKPNPWDGQIRIIKDQNGWAEQFQAESVRLAFPQPRISSEELAELDSRFWIRFWNALRVLKRGDTNKPFAGYLGNMAATLPRLVSLLPEDDPARLELMQIGYGRDAQANRQQMATLLDAYIAARSAIIRRHNLTFFPNQGFENEIKRLVNKML